jgi:hypothetical protein
MSGKSAVLAKHDDDVVVVSAYRTAITKVGSFLFATQGYHTDPNSLCPLFE